MERFALVWNSLINDPVGVHIVGAIALLLLVVISLIVNSLIRQHIEKQIGMVSTDIFVDGFKQGRESMIREMADTGLKDLEKHLGKM